MKTKKYVIKWIHDVKERRTVCMVSDEKWRVQHGTGMTHCASTDTYCRDKGRKLSLARALKDARLSKEERTEIWEAYRTMGNKKRW